MALRSIRFALTVEADYLPFMETHFPRRYAEFTQIISGTSPNSQRNRNPFGILQKTRDPKWRASRFSLVSPLPRRAAMSSGILCGGETLQRLAALPSLSDMGQSRM